MKLQTVFLVFLVFFTFTLFGQVEQASDPETVSFIEDEAAEYPGGISELSKFLNKNLVYPASALSANSEGKVIIQVVIEKDGSINPGIVKKEIPGCPECTQEVIRVIQLMPKWKPGKMNGQPARMFIILPITFQNTDPGSKENR